LGWRHRREFPEITTFKAWMSTWRGIGDIVIGMERQGFAVSLRKLVDDGWNAAFEEHRLLAPAGHANAPTPFKAAKDAAGTALNAKPMPTPGGEEMVEEVRERDFLLPTATPRCSLRTALPAGCAPRCLQPLRQSHPSAYAGPSRSPGLIKSERA
jgi:hypothetical protein